ncbi:MAG: tetratricopeptide repeat protein [Lentisphaerae bacterium]|nr:tetratricopeptide repeat protein [Lentisphaerota bacterium]
MAEIKPTGETASQPGNDDSIAAVKTYWRQNGLYVAIGVVIAGAVILGVGGYVGGRQRAEEKASQMLSVAQSQKQLEELVSQYPDSKSVPLAKLAMAVRQYEAEAYDDAFGVYVQFLQQYPDHPLAAVAELGVAVCQEAKEQNEDALNSYTAFLGKRPDHRLMPQAMFGKARCLAGLKRFPEARAVYEDFLAANPKSGWTQYAETGLNAVNRRLRSVPASPAAP